MYMISKHSNPLLSARWNTPYDTPPFSTITIDCYKPAFELAVKLAKCEVDSIAQSSESPTFANTIEALEHSGSLLERVSSIFFNLNSAETSDQMQAMAQEVSPLLTDYSSYVSLSEPLFERVKRVYDSRSALPLTVEQQTLLDKIYKSFVRSGATLNPEQKERYRALTEQLSILSLTFGQNVLAETNASHMHLTREDEVEGLPADIKEAARYAAQAKGLNGWLITLHQPSLTPFLKYAANRTLREQLYRANAARATQGNEFDNRKNVLQLAAYRLELAQLLGYPTYAHYVLEERMAQTPEKVTNLLQNLLSASKPYAEADIAALQACAEADGFQEPIQAWDFAYYAERLKSQRYRIDDEQLRPYFRLDKVVEGVFELSRRLYGLQYKEISNVDVYHPDVKAYEVADEGGELRAILYLDFFPREGKRGGAWMTEFRPQRKKGDEDIRPLVSLVCNFTKPLPDKPSLLTFDEVNTFLHEFGHALHGMLSDCTYASLSGTSVYRDFVELPSQLMENFTAEKEFLDLFVTHYQTGEKIPAELVQKIVDAQTYNEGYACVRQLSFGLLDMAYHSIEKPVEESVADFEQQAIEPTRVLPKVEGALISPSFGHIFAGGYAAGYYGYKWAEVLDADAFSLFKQKGIFSKEVARSFRMNVLSKGGTEHPMVLYKRFRGQEPSIDALLKRSGFTVK